MAERKWKGIRPGSRFLEVYNEGLLVWLFDQASLPALKKSEADFQGGFATEEAEVDPMIRQQAKEGLFFAYELRQDDEVAVEIVVGPPLTKKELAVGRWHKPQKGFLKLPSGKLRVHTPNTLPLHEDPTDQPGKADVPPGDYLVTLYRLDWDELKNDGVVSDDDTTDEWHWHGPQEVIVLTPADPAKPAKGNKSYLRFPQKSSAVWKGKYEFIDGTFHGLVMFPSWWENLFVNLDRRAARKLGLEPGMSFRVEVADFIVDVLYFGDCELSDAISTAWAKPLAGDRPEFAVAYRPDGVAEIDHHLCVQRVVTAKAFPIHNRWMPGAVRVLPERYPLPSKPG